MCFIPCDSPPHQTFPRQFPLLYIRGALPFPRLHSPKPEMNSNMTTLKTLFAILCLTFLTQYEAAAQTDFELDPNQSMLMTGKGPGQDAAINPYLGEDCYAIVENTGNQEFSIRVQQRGTIIETIAIAQNEEKKVALYKGFEMYFDTESEGKVNAKVDFEKMKRRRAKI